MKTLCVFCGSSVEPGSRYARAAEALGALLARRGIRLVYGGGRVGMMGVLADACLAGGGHVVGVIPTQLWDRELGHTGASEMRVVASMHERKAQMAELSDAFVALPGGIGTMEEFFEIWTWGQLGLHAKPYGLLNAGGYFDPLTAFLDHMVAEGFLRREQREAVLVADEPEALLDRLEQARAPSEPRLIRREET